MARASKCCDRHARQCFKYRHACGTRQEKSIRDNKTPLSASELLSAILIDCKRVSCFIDSNNSRTTCLLQEQSTMALNPRVRLLTTIALTVACLVLFHIRRGLNNLCTVVDPGSVTTSALQQDAILPNNRNSSCTDILDALDRNFDLRRRIRQQHTRDTSDELDKLDPHTSKKLFDLFEPEANCFSDERFGGPSRFLAFGDGGKFMCGIDLLKKRKGDCLVYSIGSNNDISFEKAIHKSLACETHTFDPTLSEPFVGGAYATFHPWGFGKQGEEVSFVQKDVKANFTAQSIQTIQSKLGHTGRRIDILKIDCEGCEYGAMPGLFKSIQGGHVVVDQIQIELHRKMFDRHLFDAADAANMRIFHKERNGWGCSGYQCVEYAFVSETFLRAANSELVCGNWR